MSKQELYKLGKERVKAFCEANDLPVPSIRAETIWHFGACAYYRPQYIRIHLPSCSAPATQSQVRNWNWPGSTTDREPYGVLCHELGHHVDYLTGDVKGKFWSNYGEQVKFESGEKEITSYCPNPSEWFAEMFRLFVTNPFLLKALRPRTFEILFRKFNLVSAKPGVWSTKDDWVPELGKDVPPRILANLYKKVGSC